MYSYYKFDLKLKNIKRFYMNIEEMKISDFELIKNNLESDFDDFWNENSLKQELLNKERIYIIAKDLDKNEILGFAGISCVLDEAELMNIVVKRNKRRNGIGKALLEKIINICKENNIKLLKLEVNEINLPAINLYKSFGFIQTGIRKKYYNNCDSAILMDLNLTPHSSVSSRLNEF